jgi:pyruvate formate lyase activating enzyme
MEAVRPAMKDQTFRNEISTRYWEKLSDGRVQCNLCPRFCKLHEGQEGFCFVRANRNNSVVLTTYGRSSGFCVDPIEKKPLNHFLPGTPVLSFGTAGCNLSCKFCQNWDISKARETDILTEQAFPETIAESAQKLGCRSVAYTYNDPVIFMEYAIDVAKACQKKGIRSIAVTAGYINKEPLEEFFQFMDAANVDLKGFTERFYFQLTGGHLQPVLDTLLFLKHETDVWLEITTLLIPGENDSKEEIDAMTRWGLENLGADVPWHFTAFHPDFKMLETPATPIETLRMARNIAINNGMRYVYIGNVHDNEGENTFCHHCGRKIIGRNGYEITAWNLSHKGNCLFCGSRAGGVFEGPPGNWGNRRLPVNIGAL